MTISAPSQAAPLVAPQYVPLLYHELRPDASAYSYVLPVARFAEHLRLFAGLAYNAAATARPLLTFDDGHRSDHDHALPLLAQYGTRAHFFVTAGWTGTRAGFMEPRHLRALHDAGHTVGAHSWSHALLTQCDDHALKRELVDARTALEDHIGAPVTTLSLPGGRGNARVLRAAREAGYTTIWTSVPGATASTNVPVVGRFNVLAGATDELLTRLLDLRSGALRRAGQVSRAKAMAQHLLGDRMYAKLWAAMNHHAAATQDAAGSQDASEPQDAAA